MVNHPLLPKCVVALSIVFENCAFADSMPSVPQAAYSVDVESGAIRFDDGTVIYRDNSSKSLEKYNEKRHRAGLSPVQLFATGLFPHGVPYDEALKFRNEDLRPLMVMLRDPNWKDAWPNIVAALTILGDEAVADFVIDYIDEPVHSNVPESLRAKKQGVVGLGYIVRHHQYQRAMDYLSEGLETQSWQRKELAKASPPKPVDQVSRTFAMQSARGLALSKDPRAIAVLRQRARNLDLAPDKVKSSALNGAFLKGLIDDAEGGAVEGSKY